jgi:hypothetical protein
MLSEVISSLVDILPYVGQKAGEEVLKLVVSDAYTGLKKQLARILTPEEKSTAVTPTLTKADFTDRLIEYLERHDRALETTLQCLEQLSDRIKKIGTPDSMVLSIGLMPVIDQAELKSNRHIQHILDDSSPGLPQTIKSGYSLLHLLQGNTNLAAIYARSTLRINPTEARALYALGLLKLQSPIRGLSPPNADEAEKFLATAAEAGLSPQCALPRAALRFDHYRYRGRKIPFPAISDLSLMYEAHRSEATSWPYGVLNTRFPKSREFTALWGG